MHLHPIKLNNNVHGQKDKFPEKSFLLPFDHNYAIVTDGLYISIVEVVPDPERPGEFKPNGIRKYIQVGIEIKRTIEGLKEVVNTLRTMTAFELLTQHYNLEWATFNVHHDKDYVADYDDGEEALPVNEYGGLDGKDY
jgi:hypothetical protein